MLKSESKIVLCDWDRGVGKSYTSLQHIIKNGGRYLIVCHSINLVKVYASLIEEFKREYSDVFRDIIITKNSIEINFNRIGQIKNFKNAKIIFSKDVEVGRGQLFDYVIFEERIPTFEEMNCLNEIMSLKQIFIMTTLNRDRNNKYFEYITDKDEPLDTSNEEWVDNEIKKLMKEFSKIPNSENTTKTRMIILEMIEKFKNMRE